MNTVVAIVDNDAAPSAGSDGYATSAVAWSAIFAGAAGATALSLVLLLLGIGLGLTVVSPWSSNPSVTAVGVSTLAWLAFMQLAASSVGGYLAGRLRTRWVRVHTEEVFFRDTAHGFLTWAVATLAMAWLFAAPTTALLSGGAQATAGLARGVATAGAVAASQNSGQSNSASNPAVGAQATEQGAASSGSPDLNYTIDSLLRVTPTTAAPSGNTANDERVNVEVTRIFVRDLIAGAMSTADRTYVAQVIAQRTGTAQPDAEQRVATTFSDLLDAKNTAINKAKQAADSARKAAISVSLWMVISLFLGAFVASWLATFGGRLRDKTSLNS